MALVRATVLGHLAAAGCRDFFTATWAEAAALMPLPEGVSLSVLHGVGASDMVAARTLPARPVLNSLEQVARWRAAGEGRPCDVMVDTGMNRLGLRVEDATSGALDGLADRNLAQPSRLGRRRQRPERASWRHSTQIRQAIPARRYSLANSAGFALAPIMRST
jgi:alanine racemase